MINTDTAVTVLVLRLVASFMPIKRFSLNLSGLKASMAAVRLFGDYGKCVRSCEPGLRFGQPKSSNRPGILGHHWQPFVLQTRQSWSGTAKHPCFHHNDRMPLHTGSDSRPGQGMLCIFVYAALHRRTISLPARMLSNR